MSQNIIAQNSRPDPFSRACDAWTFLASVTDYEKMNRFGQGRTSWNLDAMRRLLAFLGRPERDLPAVQIGGSKGKGSVARLVEAALREAGLHTGLYTSPHVDTPLERIQTAGSSVDERTFLRAMNRLHPALVAEASPSGDRPTFFEIFTALALLIFHDAAVDAAILEVGLGGPLDATSAMERPRVSVITSISRDHTHLLGETTPAIAADKAGIFRAGVPAVVGVRPGEAAFPPLAAAARDRGAPLLVRGRDFEARAYRPDPGGARIDLRVGDRWTRDVELGLLGPFQAVNAATAWAVLHAFAGATGRSVDEEAARRAWRTLRIPGRMDVLKRDPFLVVDGAHNRASALALLEALALHFPGRPIHLVLAMAGDKLVEETVGPLFEAAARVYVTRMANPRSLPPERLADYARRLGTNAPRVHASSGEAVEAALAEAPENAVVVATGSLYLAGEIRAWAGASSG